MNKPQLPALPDLSTIAARLPMIFPDGIDNRNYLIREISAKTIFVMLYIGAIYGSNRWVRPNQVTRMTDTQAAKSDPKSRIQWAEDSLNSSKMKSIRGAWYAQNTREPIRDETIRYGLIQVGAIIEREDLPKTSSKPRYALTPDFAELFDKKLKGKKLESKISKWKKGHLSVGALARIRLVKKGITAVSQEKSILVTFPNKEIRRMSPGPSSVISKAVIEEFSSRFLSDPGVIFLSESGDKVVARDDEMARMIGLYIEVEKNLPDIILVDLGGKEPLLVFVEVVATDGPVSSTRKRALTEIVEKGGFEKRHVAFVTAFLDKGSTVYRKLSSSIAWGTFVWFVSEPDCIIILNETQQNDYRLLIDLLDHQ